MKVSGRSALLALAGLCHVTSSMGALYLPGVVPAEFEDNELVELKVNKVTSVKTQLPYNYYSLPVCKPEVVRDSAENLGEVLQGDKIANSDYILKMKTNAYCNVLCRREYTEDEIKRLQSMIADDYRVHWVVDNLPAATRTAIFDESQIQGELYEAGFPLGEMSKDKKFNLNNHVRITMKYHENPSSFRGARVVGFIVDAFSVRHKYSNWPSDNDVSKVQLTTCNAGKFVDSTMDPMTLNAAGEIVWTYDVKWEPSETEWTSRWNVFLDANPDDQIHWFSIINSLMIVLFLTGMIAMIMMRTLHKDIARYNEETTEEAQEETGWKLVHGDVFRPPQFSPMLLSVYCGTGVQLICMVIILMVFAVFGFLSPANSGGLMTAMLFLFVFMGFVAGYFAAQLYKMFGGKAWKKNTLLTALLYPGTVFAVFFVVNLFVWHQGSSGAVPFGTMFALLVLWFGISVPLVFLGSYFGFKREEIKNPCRFNQIPRQIPEQAFYANSIFSMLVGGILPFGAVFIEVFFIMSSIWQHQIYYVFGFLFLVLLILVATCAEITIVMCYFQLCSEDYNWWWRAYLTSGSASIYLFLYSILYYVTKLDISKFAAAVLYFAYMWLVSYTFFLLTGTIGFYACFWFVRKIYGAIKVD